MTEIEVTLSGAFDVEGFPEIGVAASLRRLADEFDADPKLRSMIIQRRPDGKIVVEVEWRRS